jgi:hypothetical protein
LILGIIEVLSDTNIKVLFPFQVRKMAFQKSDIRITRIPFESRPIPGPVALIFSDKLGVLEKTLDFFLKGLGQCLDLSFQLEDGIVGHANPHMRTISHVSPPFSC